MPKENFIAISLTLLSSICCLVFFNIVFDDSYDGLISNISNGQFSNFSLMDQHYLGILVIRDFYKILQDLMPNINVFATMYLVSSILSLYYTLLFLLSIPLKNKSFIFSLIILLITSLIFLENIVSITHTRFATVFCGVSLLFILWGNLSNKAYFFHFLVFLFGMLTRPESGIGMLLIVGVGFLIHKFQPLLLVKRFFFPFSSILVLVLIFLVHKHYTNRFEIKIEPDIEYAFSTDRLMPIDSMKNAADSLKYLMGTSGMFIDTSYVSASFLKSLVVNQYQVDFIQLKNSFFNIYELFYKYNLFALIIILAIIFSIFTNNRKLSKILLFILFFYSLLIYLDYTVKVEDRHFVSLNIISSILMLMFFNKLSFRNIVSHPKPPFVVVISLLLISSFSTVSNALGNQVQVADDVACLESVMEDIEMIYQDKIIVASLATFHLFDRKYTFRNNNYKKNTYLIYDLSNYSIVPRYLAYLSEICNCSAEKPEQFFNWAFENNVIFLSVEERFELIEKYLILKHNIDSEFEEVVLSKKHQKPNCMNNSVYKDYFIKSLTMKQL